MNHRKEITLKVQTSDLFDLEHILVSIGEKR